MSPHPPGIHVEGEAYPPEGEGMILPVAGDPRSGVSRIRPAVA